MYKAILFDMDGTLLNSDELVLKIYKELTTKYPPKTALKTIQKDELLAKSYLEVIHMLYESEHDFYLSSVTNLHTEYKNIYLKLYPQTLSFLMRLKKEGYLLGLVTSEMKNIAYEELKLMGIDRLFDAIITFDDVKKPKPHAEGLLKIMKQLHVNPDEVLWIGDQKSDGLAGKSASIHSGLIARKKKKREIESSFDFIFSSYQDILYHIVQNAHPLTLVMDKPSLNIIQFTDLHLMNDEKDHKTFHLMDHIIHKHQPDFIALTGDQTMSPHAIMLYQSLRDRMETYSIPYSYIFGNHDTEDGVTHKQINQIMKTSKNLLFKNSPSSLGYSNYVIEVRDLNQNLRWLLFMLDSHIDQTYVIDQKATWGYGSLSYRQLDWYKNTIKYYTIKEHRIIPSMVFMHIPINEYNDSNPKSVNFIGEKNENVSSPPISDGFFDVVKSLKSTQAIFVGHDHLNDFSFVNDGIMLAYGRVSGYYEYAMPGFPKGARIITLHQETFETSIDIYSET
ncbi:MAG: HAD family hydrolase [Bacillota bacterium]|nr:MAG: HAD family hydrolase [Bacillota bacterium]